MVRAGIFIGVDRTGDLDVLQDAARGARRMHEWATRQGAIAPENAHLITDADDRRVTPDALYEAVRATLEGPGVDQLIVYFAGHGVNINRSEHWLLSDAPGRTSAAVNVSGSVELARYCGIPHVVFFSDACRVAPDGIRAQNVRGQDIFPNEGGGDRAKPVDQFFACLLGRTAAEIKDPHAAATLYNALYTGELLAALGGERRALLEAGTAAGDASLYVRPRPLERHLEDAIPRIVMAQGLANRVNQSPDAIITSDDAWLAAVAPAPAAGAGPGDSVSAIEDAVDGIGAGPAPEPEPAATSTMDLRAVSRMLSRSAIAGSQSTLDQGLRTLANIDSASGQLARSVADVATPFGPDHFESQCGIKVRGARVASLFAPRADLQRFDDADGIVRVNSIDGRAASVLLGFEDGSGTVVPVFQDFIAALTFEDGELVDVTYEPSANTQRWREYEDRLGEIRALRAVAAAASQYGRFRLDDGEAMPLARQMQYAKSLDPTLSVYAAYAYHDLQDLPRIADMAGWLAGDIGATFFDLPLLARKLVDRTISPDMGIVPFTPLLSQGWALLRASRVRLHPALEHLDRTMKESLWSLYDASGVEMLARALQSGEVR